MWNTDKILFLIIKIYNIQNEYKLNHFREEQNWFP